MRPEDCIPLNESMLDKFYSGLPSEDQKRFVLIEDHPDGKHLIVSYFDNDKSEKISPGQLWGLLSSWDDRLVVRIDKNRFVSCQDRIIDTEYIRDARKECRKVMALAGETKGSDLIDKALVNLLRIIEILDDEVDGLVSINNEYFNELSYHELNNQVDEPSLVPEPAKKTSKKKKLASNPKDSSEKSDN